MILMWICRIVLQSDDDRLKLLEYPADLADCHFAKWSSTHNASDAEEAC